MPLGLLVFFRTLLHGLRNVLGVSATDPLPKDSDGGNKAKL